MASSNSRKHARKVTLDAAVSSAIEKAVDARKMAAFTVGAAGVIAGAAFAFGATPAMAAETGAATTSTDAAQTPVTAGEKAGAAAENAGEKADADKKNEADKADKKNQTDVNKEDGEQSDNKEDNKSENTENTDDTKDKPTATKKRVRRAAVDENKQTETTGSETHDRAANGAENQDPNKIKPAAQDDGSTKIDINENNADTVPNAYAWGSSDNTYSVDGEKHTVTFHFAAPKDGSKITNIAIFPSKTNGFNNEKSERGIDFYSKDKNKHQAYSGEYEFNANGDGSADLKMTTLFRNGNIGGAEKYTASRSIFVYVTKDGKETIAYKTNVFRAVTLVPPKTSGSVVLKYNQELTPEKVQAAITEAGNINTERSDKKSVNDQLSGKFTENIKVKADGAYDKTTFDAINAKKAGDTNSYVAGAKTLNTYMVTDLGFKSQAIPLTVARYDTRIDKPIVEDTDPSKVSDEVKADIKRKLARLNNVSLDQVTINDQGEFTINFAGVDPNDAPKIALRDLVLKKLEEKDISVPTDDKSVIVANPLGYSSAELDRIKTAIFDANKDNKELGLTSKDQITLSYITGDLTGAGDANKGRSNGLQENNINVTIKTDKALAKFTSDITKDKLTRLPDIRTDYNVELVKKKLDGRDSDEGFSWSDDKHTTLIYRYDPTKAQKFTAPEIVKLIKATPKDQKTGLRPLTGGEELDHEGSHGKPTKSHMHYSIDKNGEPTTELTLGMMNGAYWIGDPQVANSDANMGDEESQVGKYTWDDEAGSVTVAAKQNKVFKTRLFVAPYALTYYRGVYTDPYKKNPNNTPKAINVIFVPQTNHKTKDLSKSIGEHKTIKVDNTDVPTESTYYNASDAKKNAYDKALDAATKLYAQVKDTDESKLTEEQKAQIDNATINLNKARAELDGDATKKEELKKSIDENGTAAQGSSAATGTQATNQFKNVSDPDFKDADGKPDTKKNEDAKKAKEAYDKALEDAKTLNDDENATQKAVDDAKAKLDAARAKLNDFTTNKDELNNAIAQHGHVNTGDATQADPNEKLKTADPTYQNSSETERTAYDNAVTEANRVAADPKASQKEVNKAIEDLKKAKADLDKNATDKSPLDAAVQKSFDNPDPTKPDKQSVFYKNAKAKTNDPDAQQVVKNYDDALKKAKEVLANDKATKADVEKAKKDLEDAEAALHADKYSTDKTDLGKALADNFSGYLMPAYFNAFDKAQAEGKDSQAAKDFKAYNDAYHAAKDLMDELNKPGSTVDQNKVDAVKKQLLDARKAIDKYATDTSKISAALLQSLAIHNSPAYKNASAGAEGSDAKKAKDAYDKALEQLQKAFNDEMPQDTVDGKPDSDPISTNNIPAKDGDTSSPDYLKSIQSHAKGQPLNRDVTKLLEKLNKAVEGLDKFKTKTDELIKSINKDSDTHPSPAFKNASRPVFQKADSSGADDEKNGQAKQAYDKYAEALNIAKKILAKVGVTQEEVNKAKKDLDDARKELDKYNTDTTKLTASVGEHGKEKQGNVPATEGTVTSDAYRNASDPHFLTADGKPDDNKNKQAAEAKKAYDKALAEAQELLKKHDDKDTPQDAKPTQTEINAALKTLDEARTKLDTYKTDTTALSTEAAKSTADGSTAAGTDFENTPEFKNADADTSEDAKGDVKAYKDALKTARDLVKAATEAGKKNSERPTQQQINDALEALKNAKKQITDNYKTDAAALKDAKDFANGAFKKTPEYKNAVALKDDDNAKQDDKDKAKTAVEALDESTNDSALKKAIEILQAFDDNGKPNQEGPTGGRIPTQAEVDAALKTLQEAMKTVTDGYKTNADKLKNEVGDKDQDGKPVVPPFEASVPYKNALEKAKTETGDAATAADSATKKLEAYNKKLKDAQDLIAQVNSTDPNADPDKKPTQKQVDDALEALKKAKKDIDDAFATNASDLKDEAAKSTAYGATSVGDNDFENTTEFKNADAKKTDDGKDNADVDAYKKALKKARTLLNKFDENGKPKSDATDIPTQQEVDEALNNLKEIKKKILANYVTSPKDLYDEVDKSKDGDTDTNTDVFENTPAFKNATAKGDDASKQALKDYNDKLKAAKDMLEKFDRTTGKPKAGATGVPTQKELDDALKALQEAKKKIEDKYSTVKYDLRQEAGKDSDFTKSPEYQNAQAKGDDASKQALDEYKNALDEANSVLADPNATQAEVDAALKRLQDAKAKLKAGNSTDKSKLQSEADGDADFRKSPYFIIGNKADIEAYENALAEARRVLADPNATQAEVDAALKKLKDAKKRILDFLSHFGGSGNGTGDWNGYGFVNGHESYGALVDKTALQIEVNNAVETNANTAQAVAYRQALAEAKSVLNNPNATQAQVDAALRKLQAAKAALLNSLSGASGHKIAKTGAATGLFAGFAAIFAGLGAAGVASRRRKHSKE
ncbi:FIVAR domain-containing protein [Gardnerella sp. KA00603]|uniref:peptidase n=1 Tax=Gardnerella sp. KA00603 TaxID=2749076 RepID=UPI003BA864B7